MAVLPRRAKWLTAAPIFLQALVGSIQHHKQLIIAESDEKRLNTRAENKSQYQLNKLCRFG